MIGHLAPEAAVGGPIAALRDGDKITIDADKRRIDVALSASQIAQRMKAWRPPAPRYTQGVFAKYAALVSSASEGAVTRPSTPAPLRAAYAQGGRKTPVHAERSARPASANRPSAHAERSARSASAKSKHSKRTSSKRPVSGKAAVPARPGKVSVRGRRAR
jgi:hypothetical protein